jgi:hypothetical protein
MLRKSLEDISALQSILHHEHHPERRFAAVIAFGVVYNNGARFALRARLGAGQPARARPDARARYRRLSCWASWRW